MRRAVVALLLVACGGGAPSRGATGTSTARRATPASLAPFGEFEYVASPGLGFCVEEGHPVRVILTRRGERIAWERSIRVAEGTDGARCFLESRGSCIWAEDSEGVLSVADARRVEDAFAATHVRRDPDGCARAREEAPCPENTHCFEDDVIEASDPCRLDTFRWDTVELRPEPCSPEAHVSPEDGTRLLGLLSRLGG